MMPNRPSWRFTFSVWLSALWREIIFGWLIGAIIGALIGLGLGMSTDDWSLMRPWVTGLGWLLGMFVSLWALRRALARHGIVSRR